MNEQQLYQTGYFNNTLDLIIISLATISSLVSLLIPTLYFVFRKCRQHPTQLIAKISLLQTISNYNVVLIAVNIYRFQDIIGIKAVFDILTFNPPTQPSQTQFCQINFIVYICVELLSIAYNFCFSLDLLLTLNYPFFAGKKRMKYYNFFSILFCAVLIPLSWTETQTICQQSFHQRSIYRVPFAFLIMLGAFFFLSLIIIIFSYIQENKLDEIRSKYVRHHRLVIFILIIVWIFPIVVNVLIYLGDQESLLFQISNYISFFSLILSGGIVNIARFIVDPGLWRQIKDMIKFKLFSVSARKKARKMKIQVGEDIWNLPIANAVAKFHNQRVVHHIIQIVNEICKEEINNDFLITSILNPYQRKKVNYNKIEQDQIEDILNGGTARQLQQLVKMSKKITLSVSNEKVDQNEKSLFTIVPQKGQKSQGRLIITAQSFADPIFTQLRKVNGITQQVLQKSLDILSNNDNIRNARQSLGASGSFFFFSYDHSLVIKTIPDNQKDALLKLLPYYYKHLRKYSNSLFGKIYGLFSIQIAGISRIQLIMMENTFQAFEDQKIVYKIYDLKGSTVSRQVYGSRQKVLKDINYYKSPDCFFFLTQQDKQKLLKQIKSDITLLKDHNIMDYSLLVGVGVGRQQSQEDGWRFMKDSANLTNRVYSLAIIDYLQQFNFTKYAQLMLKKIFKGGGDISSVDTQTYYQRFITFVERLIVIVKLPQKKSKSITKAKRSSIAY